MTEHNIETEIDTEIEAGKAEQAFTDDLSDEALDRGEEGRWCHCRVTALPTPVLSRSP